MINLFCQMLAKRLKHREYNTSGRRKNRISFHKVKLSIGVWSVFRIQIIQIHYPEQDFIFCGIAFGNILHISTNRVIPIYDIEFKVILLNIHCSQVIHVFHHQIPGCQLRRLSRTFQQLYNQRIGRSNIISRKFTHLKYFTSIRVLVCHTEYFVRVQLVAQRNDSQSRVQGIFRLFKFAGTLYFFIIFSTIDTFIL